MDLPPAVVTVHVATRAPLRAFIRTHAQGRCRVAPVRLAADEGCRRVWQLVGRLSAELLDGLDCQIQTVDVALTDKPPIGVTREAALRTEIAIADEIFGLARTTESQCLELIRRTSGKRRRKSWQRRCPTA